MKHFKDLGAFLVLGLLVFGTMTAWSAILTNWSFNVAGDYTISDENKIDIINDSVVLLEEAEFQVNDEIEGDQNFSSFVELDNGNLFLIWRSSDLNNPFTDNDGNYLAGKIVDTDGATVVPEFQVNQGTVGFVTSIVISKYNNGNVIVGWSSDDTAAAETDNSGSYLVATIYDEDGTRLVDEFQVNDEIAGVQFSLNFAPLDDGNMFAVWASADTAHSGNDTDSFHIAAKVFDPNGGDVVAEFQVNDEVTGSQAVPEVAKLDNGNLFITWESEDIDHSGNDTDGYHVAAKIIDSSGASVVPEFQINTEIESDQRVEKILLLDSGDVLITWNSQDLNNAFTDSDLYYIAGAVFDDAGQEVVAEFQINDFTESIQIASDPVQLDNGNILIMWNTFAGLINSDVGDASGLATTAKIFDESFNTVRSEYLLTRGTSGNQIGRDLLVVDSGDMWLILDSTDSVFASDDTDIYTALRLFQSDGSGFYYDDEPSITLNSGVDYVERIRSFIVNYLDENQGEVEVQLSPDDGVNWYYFDGQDWVSTVGLGDAKNTVVEVNDALGDFYSQFGAGTLSWRLFLVSDGTQFVVVDTVELSENEIPVIGVGDANVSIDVPQNRENVAQFAVVDPEDDNVEFSISGGADSSLFAITTDGLLSIGLNGDLGETYEVVIRATDEFNGFTEQTVNVSVIRAPSSSGSGVTTVDNPFQNIEKDQVDQNADGVKLDSSVEKEFVKTSTDRGELCVMNFENLDEFSVNTISRIEAVKMFLDLMCVDVSKYENELPFFDKSLMSKDEIVYLKAGYSLGIIKGYPDGYFRPYKNLNYAEFSALLYRSVEMDVLESNPWYIDYVKVTNLVEEDKLGLYVTEKEFYQNIKSFYGF